MKIVNGLLAAVLFAAVTATAFGAEPIRANGRTGPNDERIPSPSDKPRPAASKPQPIVEPVPEEPVPVPVADQDATADCDEAVCCVERAFGRRCGCGGLLNGCADGAPWTMPQPCSLQRMGVKVGGWLEQGATFNANGTGNGFNGPVATNDWANKYQMNQLWLFLDRPANTGGCGWAVGGHVDMIYGTDFRFGINHGLEDRINDMNGESYGLVIPQFYLEIAYNDLSVKLGHFAAILDYEAVPCVMNPFYSHSYSYGYTVPQLVTGALADYKVTDRFSVQAGVHRGWLMFEDNNDKVDFMGGVKWATPDQSTVLSYAISVGDQWEMEQGERFVYSLVWQQQLTERLRYVLVQNLGTENNSPLAVPGDADAEWYGVNQYLLYKLNRCWSLNFRAEWLRDDDGARIAGPGNIPGVDAFNGHGFAGDFYELTLGLTWHPHPNLIVRPEVRWDRYDGPPGFFADVPNRLPFGNGDKDDQLTFGLDAILTF